MKSLFLTIPLFTLSTAICSADWRTDTGWNDLQTWASQNSITIPSSAFVIAGMAEAGANYMFNETLSNFSDITTVTNVTNSSSGISSHANTVAGNFFGQSTSVAPDIDNVYVYSTNDFTSKIQRLSSTWPMHIMSHAYVSSEVIDPAGTTRLMAGLDESTDKEGVLHIVGVDNTASSNLPQIWSHSYNSISVGRSDGQHSHGTINSGYEGAGRQKPEIVTPITTTSYGTGATASVASLLKALANTHSSSNAALPLTIKSCILAGADKNKFPSWDNTATRPIDEVYGAGEINILNSFAILNSPESSANSAVDRYGWDHHTLVDSSNVDYHFTVPSYSTAASISANLSWLRTTTTERVKGVLIAAYNPLSDLSLTLKNSSNLTIFSSDSPVDNLEHIWQTQLTPGNYTLTVNKSSGADTDYTLAWRVDIETNHPPVSFTKGASDNSINFDQLAPSHNYTLQRSSNLSEWADVITTTSTPSGTLSFTDTNTALGEKVFYRLNYFTQ